MTSLMKKSKKKFNKPLTIFVSRELDEDSPFRALETLGHTLIGESLIDFEDVIINTVPTHEAVFFYSQRAIYPYIKAVGYSTEVEYGVMGPASQATFLELTGHKAQIEGQGDYEALASSLDTQWADKIVLFPVGRRSMKRFKRSLPQVTQKHVIVYDNTAKEVIDLPACDLVALTSPINVEAYCSAMDMETPLALFSIGQTTAKKMKAYTSREIFYCEDPSEANLYRLVDKFISSLAP